MHINYYFREPREKKNKNDASEFSNKVQYSQLIYKDLKPQNKNRRDAFLVLEQLNFRNKIMVITPWKSFIIH